MKKILFISFILTTSIFAQKKVNNYKYIIVPNKFEFAKKADQYQTSSLTKFLFNKYGFTAFLSNEKLPQDLAQNKCVALTGTIKDKSGMFTTKSIVELRDCFNNLIYSSKEGRSRNKDYKKGYHEAIRNAFKSIQTLKYKYDPSKKIESKNQNVPVLVATPKVIESKKIEAVNSELFKVLYAQPKENGFQIVDSEPKIIFKVLKTTIKEVYILENRKGVLYKNGNIWIAEYYKGKENVIEKFQIKF